MGLLSKLAVVPAQTIRLFWCGWGLGAGGLGTGTGAQALAERALMQCGQLNGGRATSEHSCSTYAVRGERLRLEMGGVATSAILSASEPGPQGTSLLQRPRPSRRGWAGAGENTRVGTCYLGWTSSITQQLLHPAQKLRWFLVLEFLCGE